MWMRRPPPCGNLTIRRLTSVAQLANSSRVCPSDMDGKQILNCDSASSHLLRGYQSKPLTEKKASASGPPSDIPVSQSRMLPFLSSQASMHPSTYVQRWTGRRNSALLAPREVGSRKLWRVPSGLPTEKPDATLPLRWSDISAKTWSAQSWNPTNPVHCIVGTRSYPTAFTNQTISFLNPFKFGKVNSLKDMKVTTALSWVGGKVEGGGSELERLIDRTEFPIL